MNDERFLKDWLQDTSDPHASPSTAADKVVARLPETKQRSRWWPLRPSRRSSVQSTSRTRLMLNPVTGITAGAALAGVLAMSFLVSVPFDIGPGSTPNGAELDPADAAVVTGTIIASPNSDDTEGTSEMKDSVLRTEGIHYTNVWETSDPRLSGTATYDAEWLRFPLEDFQVEAAFHVVENDEGRWVGSGSTLVNRSQLGENTDIAILRGEGAFEGLTAYVQMDWTVHPATIEAAIFPGEMPVAPEPTTK